MASFLRLTSILFLITLLDATNTLFAQVEYVEIPSEITHEPATVSVLPFVGSMVRSAEMATFKQLNAENEQIALRKVDPSISNDPAFKLIPKKDGGFVSRYNVSVFEAFDSYGRSTRSYSNSSGSALGESVSEWATNKDQSLWVLINPIIKTAAGEGSAATIWKGEQKQNLFYAQDQRIAAVNVSENGLFVALVSVPSSGEGEGKLQVFDRQANVLLQLEIKEDFEPIGVELSTDNEYVTLFSSRRAQVYGLPSGKLYGSTSFRNTLIDVELSPQSLKLYALTGALSENELDRGVIRMVDFKARKTDKSEGFISIKRTHKEVPVQLISKDGNIESLGLKSVLRIK